MFESPTIEGLARKLSLLKDEKIIFEETISKLKSELELIEKQRVEEKQASLIDRNEEIDDLVREIEHCIKQLK